MELKKLNKFVTDDRFSGKNQFALTLLTEFITKGFAMPTQNCPFFVFKKS